METLIQSDNGTSRAVALNIGAAIRALNWFEATVAHYRGRLSRYPYLENTSEGLLERQNIFMDLWNTIKKKDGLQYGRYIYKAITDQYKVPMINEVEIIEAEELDDQKRSELNMLAQRIYENKRSNRSNYDNSPGF